MSCLACLRTVRRARRPTLTRAFVLRARQTSGSSETRRTTAVLNPGCLADIGLNNLSYLGTTRYVCLMTRSVTVTALGLDRFRVRD